jgi:acyl carrier protein
MPADPRAVIAAREELLDALRGILIRNLDVRREPDEIDPDTPLFGSGLGLDSVDAVELSLAVESAYRVALPGGPRSRAALRTLNTLADLILASRAEGGR